MMSGEGGNAADTKEPARFPDRPGHVSPFSFREDLMTATPRVFICQVLAAACILVYVVMCVRGVSPVQPTIDSLIQWGADFGPSIVRDGETWRLLTNVFVHVGFIHLAMNMWCLLAFGPLVERLYGNIPFLVLYLLAGLGGSIASMSWNPSIVSAGASGAIFGIIGALLAFVLVHRHAIPAEILGPLRSSAVAFTGYNLLFGFFTPGIDNAAHIGGLVTGFVAGLVMQRRWPASQDRRGWLRQLSIGAVIALLLGAVTVPLERRIRRDPHVKEVIRSERFQRFWPQLEPSLARFDDQTLKLQQLLERIRTAGKVAPGDPILHDIAQLQSEATSLVVDVRNLKAPDDEIRAMRDQFVTVLEHQATALTRLQQALVGNAPDPDLISGPDGFNMHLSKLDEQIQIFKQLEAKCAQSHGIQLAPQP